MALKFQDTECALLLPVVCSIKRRYFVLRDELKMERSRLKGMRPSIVLRSGHFQLNPICQINSIWLLMHGVSDHRFFVCVQVVLTF